MRDYSSQHPLRVFFVFLAFPKWLLFPPRESYSETRATCLITIYDIHLTPIMAFLCWWFLYIVYLALVLIEYSFISRKKCSVYSYIINVQYSVLFYVVFMAAHSNYQCRRYIVRASLFFGNEEWNPCMLLVNYKMLQPLGKQYWGFSKNRK